MKVLILYESFTGNTEKVALRMKDAFEKNQHETDIYKIENIDPENLPFNFEDYDFLCAGSPVRWGVISSKFFRILHGRSREGKIVPGPKKGAVFATYGGAHLGPKEVEAALKLLEIGIEHQKFRCVGSFPCLGKAVDFATPEWYYGDIRDRPNATDLDNAEKFIREILKSESSLPKA